jgi:hypothetical protein
LAAEISKTWFPVKLQLACRKRNVGELEICLFSKFQLRMTLGGKTNTKSRNHEHLQNESNPTQLNLLEELCRNSWPADRSAGRQTQLSKSRRRVFEKRNCQSEQNNILCGV